MGGGGSTSLPKDIAALYEKTWQKENQRSKPRLIDNFEEHVENILESLHKADSKPLKQRMELVNAAGDKMVDTKTIEAICDELVTSLQKETETGKRARVLAVFNNRDGGGQRRGFVENCLECVAIVTDPLASVNACWEVAHHNRLLPELVSILQDRQKAPVKSARFCECLRIVHNLAAHEAELKDGYHTPDPPPDTCGRTNQFRANLRALAPALATCTKADEKATQLAAITGLACVKARAVTQHNIHFLLLNLRLALDNPEHQRMKSSATAMERGIRHLLKPAPLLDKERTTDQADKKRAVIESGAVAILAKGMNSDIEQERNACIDSLWFLCEEEECQKEMAEDDPLVDLLMKLYTDKSNPLQEQAEFILLNLTRHMKEGQKQIHFGKGGGGKGLDMEKRLDSDSKRGTREHVMLSYHTGSRAAVEAICKRLKDEGFDTWMDIDSIHKKGDTLDSMADAVDRSFVFLMCYSDAYETSEPCRQEARYAKTKKKPIIPVKLQADYEGDQWLGFLISGLYYYDLSGPEPAREENLRKLVATIRGKVYQGGKPKQGSPQKSPALTTTPRSPRKVEKLDTSRSVKSQKNHAARSPRNRYSGTHFCKLHPHTMHRSLEDGFGHCSCYYTDPRKEVRDWANKYKLDSHEVRSLSKTDLETLIHLKEEAPEFFYRRVWFDLRMKKLSEMQKFERALTFWAAKHTS
ncbi:uncharacterized protein [Littorina saxatilis]|uniref:uncharacterized protein isoform X2 n=1 Tax=Littorina saxatilis TaxID=31220 RepID=UPI0038B426DE